MAENWMMCLHAQALKALAADSGRRLPDSDASRLAGLLYEWVVAIRPDEHGPHPETLAQVIAEEFAAPVSLVSRALAEIAPEVPPKGLIDLIAPLITRPPVPVSETRRWSVPVRSSGAERVAALR